MMGNTSAVDSYDSMGRLKRGIRVMQYDNDLQENMFDKEDMIEETMKPNYQQIQESYEGVLHPSKRRVRRGDNTKRKNAKAKKWKKWKQKRRPK